MAAVYYWTVPNRRPLEPAVPAEATATRRRAIEGLLVDAEWSFEDLRRELRLSRRDLESELKHLERSLRRAGRRLVVTPAECSACGYTFRERAHLRPPQRCPSCRRERILDPSFRVVP